MFNTLKHIEAASKSGPATQTPQSRPIPGRALAMARNHAGGYAFRVDPWARLERFLILGADGGSYYAAERELTLENLRAAADRLDADGPRAVAMIEAVSVSGRAPKNDAAILALALAAGHADADTRAAALRALPRVARTGAHLFLFAAAVERFRGWGRALRRAVADWYLAQPLDRLLLQALKYQGRAVAPLETGRPKAAARWRHRDLLRLAHPATDAPDRARLFAEMARADGLLAGPPTGLPALAQLDAARRLPKSGPEADGRSPSIAQAAKAIRAHKLPREVVPTALLDAPEVWDALLDDMPMTAMTRSLAKMSAAGLVTKGSAAEATVVSRLADVDRLRAARIHPIALLLAARVYGAGRGVKGKLSWTPSRAVVDALERAFYAAFRNARPTGKRLMLALDVSGSMGWGMVGGAPFTPREASAAMALVALDREDAPLTVGFATRLRPLPLKRGMRLDKAVSAISKLPFGGTDCALPMRRALEDRLEVDGFVVYTDNETWFGDEHPMEALDRYRQWSGRAAKLVVVGLTATEFSIADPSDPGALDVVGFDAAAPQVIADFLRS